MTVPNEFGVREADLVELVVPNDLRSVRQSEARIINELTSCKYGADVTFAIKLALEEALTNAVKHGNDNDASKRLVVRYSITPTRTVIMVRDEGHGFTPNRTRHHADAGLYDARPLQRGRERDLVAQGKPRRAPRLDRLTRPPP